MINVGILKKTLTLFSFFIILNFNFSVAGGVAGRASNAGGDFFYSGNGYQVYFDFEMKKDPFNGCQKGMPRSLYVNVEKEELFVSKDVLKEIFKQFSSLKCQRNLHEYHLKGFNDELYLGYLVVSKREIKGLVRPELRRDFIEPFRKLSGDIRDFFYFQENQSILKQNKKAEDGLLIVDSSISKRSYQSYSLANKSDLTGERFLVFREYEADNKIPHPLYALSFLDDGTVKIESFDGKSASSTIEVVKTKKGMRECFRTKLIGKNCYTVAYLDSQKKLMLMNYYSDGSNSFRAYLQKASNDVKINDLLAKSFNYINKENIRNSRPAWEFYDINSGPINPDNSSYSNNESGMLITNNHLVGTQSQSALLQNLNGLSFYIYPDFEVAQAKGLESALPYYAISFNSNSVDIYSYKGQYENEAISSISSHNPHNSFNSSILGKGTYSTFQGFFESDKLDAGLESGYLKFSSLILANLEFSKYYYRGRIKEVPRNQSIQEKLKRTKIALGERRKENAYNVKNGAPVKYLDFESLSPALLPDIQYIYGSSKEILSSVTTEPHYYLVENFYNLLKPIGWWGINNIESLFLAYISAFNSSCMAEYTGPTYKKDIKIKEFEKTTWIGNEQTDHYIIRELSSILIKTEFQNIVNSIWLKYIGDSNQVSISYNQWGFEDRKLDKRDKAFQHFISFYGCTSPTVEAMGTRLADLTKRVGEY